MYNESDMHTGCESCGNWITTHYTNNIGFYCSNCLDEHYAQQFKAQLKYEIIGSKIFNYLCEANCRELTNSSFKYFKSKYYNDYLLLNKYGKHYVVKRMISVISTVRCYREDDESFYNQNESIVNSMLNLLITNRS